MISPGTVKICSLRQPLHAEWVVEAGADLFGLIFANARRQVSRPVAREIVSRARALRPDGSLRSVGVFVEQSIDDINQTADEVGLDLVQLHRPEVLARAGRIERPVILVVHAGEDTTVDFLDQLMESIDTSRLIHCRCRSGRYHHELTRWDRHGRQLGYRTGDRCHLSDGVGRRTASGKCEPGNRSGRTVRCRRQQRGRDRRREGPGEDCRIRPDGQACVRRVNRADGSCPTRSARRAS